MVPVLVAVLLGVLIFLMTRDSKTTTVRTWYVHDQTPRATIWARDATDGSWATRTLMENATEATDLIRVDPHHPQRTYDAARLSPGVIVRLYHKRFQTFAGWPPPDVVRTVDARTNPVEVDGVLFTHMRILTDVDHSEDTEDPCNPLRIATHERTWPFACLPDSLRDGNKCGVDRLGIKIGNYRGLPTSCNERLGDTLDEQGVGVFRDPVRGLLGLDESIRFPVTVPVFLNRVGDDDGGQFKVAFRRDANSTCERTYLCAARDAQSLERVRERVRTQNDLMGLLSTCEPHTDTCAS